ncbi:MAG TPA: hypothetical protein VHN77_09130 [Phycisphaerales bacterium]|nr:hypothetical protein [Phycisphaerales bacterium]
MNRRNLALLALVAAAGSAHAQIRVIFSNLAGDPSNTVPSLSNGWKPGTSSQFDRPFISPDGTKWVIGGFANEATTSDRIMVVGSGTSNAGATLILREGSGTPFDGARNYSFVDLEISMNNSGQVAVAADLDGSTLDDEVLVVYNFNGSFDRVVAREDQPEPTGTFPGNFYGSTIDSPNMFADGRVAYKTLFDGPGTATVVAPLTANNNDFVMIAPNGAGAHTIVLQEGVTPVEPAGSNWDLFDAGDFSCNADGSKWIQQGNDEGATTTDQVLVYNNGTGADVVIREGDIIYGGVGTSTAAAIDAFMSRDGSHWITTGTNSGTTPLDWVVRDGVRVAGTDEDITPASPSGELFDDAIFTSTFFSVAVNNVGDYVVGGVTNATDINTNAVLVLNGTRVIAREGDPVDVNGNGLNDDNVFVSVFNNHDNALTDDGKFYFVADLRDGAGAALNSQAFMYIDLNAVPGCDSIDFNGDGLFPDTADIDDFLSVFSGGPCSNDPNCADIDYNNDGLFPDTLDIDSLLSVFSGGPCL